MRTLRLFVYSLLLVLSGQVILFVQAQTESEAATRRTALRIFNQVINQGNLALADEFMAPNSIHYGPGGTYDLEGWKARLTALRTAMPDLTLSPELIMGEDDWVAIRYTLRGTHAGDLTLPDGTVLTPSNAAIEMPAIFLARFNEEGRLAASWDEYDSLLLREQVGMVSAMDSTDEATVDATLGVAVGDAPETVEQAHKATLRSAYEAYNEDHLDALSHLVDASYVGHGPGGDITGVDALTLTLANLRSAFPGSQVTIDLLFAQGDYVASRITFLGTLEHELTSVMGEEAVAAAGQPIELRVNSLHRLNEAGLVVEGWQAYDRLALLTQLGVGDGPEVTPDSSG